MNGKTNDTSRLIKSWGGAFFSSQFFLVRAAEIFILFTIVHLAGFREYTTFLSGTTAPGVSLKTAAIYGTIYLVLYMASVVVAPILVLAAGLLKIWGHRTIAKYPAETKS